MVIVLVTIMISFIRCVGDHNDLFQAGEIMENVGFYLTVSFGFFFVLRRTCRGLKRASLSRYKPSKAWKIPKMEEPWWWVGGKLAGECVAREMFLFLVKGTDPRMGARSTHSGPVCSFGYLARKVVPGKRLPFEMCATPLISLISPYEMFVL